jgi:hypothetical protein
MQSRQDEQLPPQLAAGERLEVIAHCAEADLIVTDRRLAVIAQDRVALDIPFDGLRRVQFDLERNRPGTLVLVPDSPIHAPQMLSVPPDQLGRASEVMTAIGSRILARGPD